MKLKQTALSCGRWIAAFVMVVQGIACSEAANTLETGPALELGTAEQALTCSRTAVCQIETGVPCDLGKWPGGVIRYKFDINVGPDEQADLQRAMGDWERLTYGIIDFRETEANHQASAPVTTIEYGGGLVPGYNKCVSPGNPCISQMTMDNAYHELGHLIGLLHHFQRYDTEHYFKYQAMSISDCIDNDTGQLATDDRCAEPSNDNRSDFGPFDYTSTMLYHPTHPDHTRWDDSPIIPGALCNQLALGFERPGCPVGPLCPTCEMQECRTEQPYGFPSRGDAAAVVEYYSTGGSSRWHKFKRTVAENTSGAGATSPFDYTLNGSVTISKDRSLAAAAYPNGNISITVTGSDSRVWEQAKVGTSFTGWANLGALPGSGTVSDPATVTTGNGRLDVVVRRGTTLYIKTWVEASGWTTWQPLGGGASAPASSPAITSWGPNRLDVFVRGTDNKLYWRKCTANCMGNTGTWSAWKVIPGGTFRGKPTAVSRGVGLIDVFVHGNGDKKLYGVTNYSDVWTGFFLVKADPVLRWDDSCPDCSSPAAMSRGTNKLDVLVRGDDDQMWITSWNNTLSSWTGYKATGGVLTSSPAGISTVRTTDRIDAFAVMAEERTVSPPPSNERIFAYGAWWKQYTE